MEVFTISTGAYFLWCSSHDLNQCNRVYANKDRCIEEFMTAPAEDARCLPLKFDAPPAVIQPKSQHGHPDNIGEPDLRPESPPGYGTVPSRSSIEAQPLPPITSTLDQPQPIVPPAAEAETQKPKERTIQRGASLPSIACSSTARICADQDRIPAKAQDRIPASTVEEENRIPATSITIVSPDLLAKPPPVWTASLRQPLNAETGVRYQGDPTR